MRRFSKKSGRGCLGLLALILLLLCARTPAATPGKGLSIPVTIHVTIENSPAQASSLEDADLTATVTARQPAHGPPAV
jgi:hypothetical protein